MDMDSGKLWMLPDYWEAVWESGGTPVILPLTEDKARLRALLDSVDGVVFTGGPDISPSVYGAAAHETTCVSKERDGMELSLLPMALSSDKPLLCICRGIQLLNAALGGTLWQDLPTERPGGAKHDDKPNERGVAHYVSLTVPEPLFALLGEETIGVNSLHHQAVRDLSPRLRPMAVSEDGLVEAVYMPDKPFVWGVQWHPERSFRQSGHSRKIFAAFLDACN